VRKAAAGLVLTTALGLGALAGGPAWAASHPTHPSFSTRAVTVPEPGDGWLTGRRQRLAAVWVLIDVGGLLFWYGSAPARRPRLLGSVGAHRGTPDSDDEPDAPVRGIGRFARPRRGPPGRL
jgi:hypothetical protein